MREAMMYADAVYMDNKVHPKARNVANQSEVWGYGSDIAIIEGDKCAIRGSDDGEDWVSNFRFRPNARGEHEGFAIAADRFEPLFMIRAMRANSSGNPFRIYAHSRGAGIGMVLTSRLSAAKLGVEITLVTFGGPPALTNQACEEMMGRENRPTIYRIMTPLDPVPMLTMGVGSHPTAGIVVRPPAWTYLVPIVRRIWQHRRWCYWRAIFD